MAERFDVSRDGSTLAGERWPGGGQTVLLLHEGVADRRGWAEVAGLLAPELTVVAYDRRGYGQTPPGTGPFSHLDDLLAVIGHAGAGPARRGTPARSAAWRPGCGWTAPASQRGGQDGAARELALDMNAVIIGNGVPETEGTAGLDAWHRPAEITVPVTVACGDLDVPYLVDRCRLLAARLPAARHHVLTGMAHQPYLESASTVAQLIRSAVTKG
jgi:pimeloyl-ACP methyl ester carboxylesterase